MIYNEKFRALLIEKGVMTAAEIDAAERREREQHREMGLLPECKPCRFDPDPNAEERFVVEGASFQRCA